MLNKINFFIIYILTTNEVLARSFEMIGKRAERSLSKIGLAFVSVGIIWAGILFLRGGGEGKQKLMDVITGAICILAFGTIIALIKNIVG